MKRLWELKASVYLFLFLWRAGARRALIGPGKGSFRPLLSVPLEVTGKSRRVREGSQQIDIFCTCLK